MGTNTHTVTVTERLVRDALELHRLAMAAAEVRNLPSPATPREKNLKGAADPTAGTAMDARRVAVADALTAVDELAANLSAQIQDYAVPELRDALNQWDGRKDARAA